MCFCSAQHPSPFYFIIIIFLVTASWSRDKQVTSLANPSIPYSKDHRDWFRDDDFASGSPLGFLLAQMGKRQSLSLVGWRCEAGAPGGGESRRTVGLRMRQNPGDVTEAPHLGTSRPFRHIC